MLVARIDKLGKRPARSLRAMPSERRFALTVFAGFALALALLGVLFMLSGDTSARIGLPNAQAGNLTAQEPARAQARAAQPTGDALASAAR